MYRCGVLLTLLALCSVLSSAPTIAAPTIAAPTIAAPTIAAPTIAAPTICAATLDRNPFGFLDAEGAPQGISVDVYRLIAERLGRPLRVQFGAPDETIAGIHQATIDLAIMFRHDDLATSAVALGPLIEVPTGVLARTALARYEQLTGLRIGYLEATPFDERFESDATLTKVPFPSVVDAFSAYLDGSIDAIAGPLQLLFYQAPHYAARNGTLFKVSLLQTRAMWLYVRSAAFSDAERAAIAQSIDEIIETNMIESFSDHYFGTRVEVP